MDPIAEQTQSRIVVKRCGGSRLYDTGAARYVTLQDLGDMLRAQQQVAVHDAVSGGDITPAVLAKIVADRH